MLIYGLILSAFVCDLASPTPQYEKFADAGSYLFNPSPMNWTDATKLCNGYNGQLAFPKTPNEADVLWGIMARYNVSRVQVGFHDLYTEGQYFTHNGKLVADSGFTLFSQTHVGSSSLNCGTLTTNGLADTDCKTTKWPSICEENSTSDHGFLDYDWVESHGFYKMYHEEVFWPRALDTCYKEGSHLVIFNSVAERDAVLTTFDLADSFSWTLWVGVHHLYVDQYYITIFGDSLETAGYAKWRISQPAGQSQVFPYVSDGYPGMSLEFAIEKKTFICEAPPT